MTNLEELMQERRRRAAAASLEDVARVALRCTFEFTRRSRRHAVKATDMYRIVAADTGISWRNVSLRKAVRTVAADMGARFVASANRRHANGVKYRSDTEEQALAYHDKIKRRDTRYV